MTDDEAEVILNQYQDLEERLGAVLQVVPFSTSNSLVVIPRLANLIVDAGSLIDTIFREEFPPPKPGSKHEPTIREFAPHYEKLLELSKIKAVLYQHPASYVDPFTGWIAPTTGKYQPLQWWVDYNKLKHARITEMNRSTLHTAIAALGALFALMARMDTFFDALLRHDMVDLNGISLDGPLRELLKLLETRKVIHSILIESELFAITRGCQTFPADIFQSQAQKLWRQKVVEISRAA